jgi:hypothetical protein
MNWLWFCCAMFFSAENFLRIPFHSLGLIVAALAIFLCPISSRADIQPPTTLIFEETLTQLSAPSPFTQSQDLWVSLADLTRATGYEVKPQGVCRKELCIPLPKNKSDYIAKHGSNTWFNLSAFARLTHQAAAHDAPRAAWYFGPRADIQNSHLSSLSAPSFTLPDMNGKMHSLSDFRGKKVLLVTWASW